MATDRLAVYRGCAPVVDVRYDPDGKRTLVEAVVEAIAEAEDTDPGDLPPLYETVDPDALERLFDRRGGAGEASAVLGFEFETWHVFVAADGRIRVCDATRPTAPEPVFEDHTG